MSRLQPAPVEQYAELFGENASLRTRIYALRPEIATKFIEFGQRLREEHLLSARLLELVRIRIAFHNQCRSCMAVRYGYGIDEGLTEELVCSLERPEEAPDLTDGERAAIGYADLLATNHLDVSDQTFAELKKHFSEAEIMELCFHVAFYVGFGRMAMSLNMIDDLPEGFLGDDEVTPWRQSELMRIDSWSAADAPTGG